MTVTYPERRRKRRFDIAVPVMLRTSQGEMLVESRDISACGMFVQGPTPVSVGSEVNMTFKIPGPGIPSEEVRFRSVGIVVRVEELGTSSFGIAIDCHRMDLITQH